MAIITEIIEDESNTSTIAVPPTSDLPLEQYSSGLTVPLLTNRTFNVEEKEKFDGFVKKFLVLIWSLIAISTGLVVYLGPDPTSIFPGLREFIYGVFMGLLISHGGFLMFGENDWGPYFWILTIGCGMFVINLFALMICNPVFAIIELIVSTLAIGAMLYYAFPTKE